MLTELVNGQTYGQFTALEYAGTCNGNVMWRCRCECGNERVVRASALRRGHIKSCGCVKPVPPEERARLFELLGAETSLSYVKVAEILTQETGRRWTKNMISGLVWRSRPRVALVDLADIEAKAQAKAKIAAEIAEGAEQEARAAIARAAAAPRVAERAPSSPVVQVPASPSLPQFRLPDRAPRAPSPGFSMLGGRTATRTTAYETVPVAFDSLMSAIRGASSLADL